MIDQQLAVQYILCRSFSQIVVHGQRKELPPPTVRELQNILASLLCLQPEACCLVERLMNQKTHIILVDHHSDHLVSVVLRLYVYSFFIPENLHDSLQFMVTVQSDHKVISGCAFQ